MLLSRVSFAQVARDGATDWQLSAGSEGEQYLRLLQVAGVVPVTPWSIRPFASREIERLLPSDSAHPWSAAFRRLPSSASRWVRPLGADVAGIFNSTFPYGFNDGPTWAGRGLTLSATAGIRGASRFLEYRIAPRFFYAQNARFPLEPTGLDGPARFADPVHPTTIDLPQRFGDQPYHRLDPGESYLAARLPGLTVGVSTGSEWWGPSFESPFLLGNNAGGFAHLFAGTDGPLAIGPVRIATRLIAGRLEQSNYSPAVAGAGRRSLAGVVATVGIRQIPGLEIGAGRLFESVYRPGETQLGEVLSPLFEGILKSKLAGSARSDTANQLASVFARLVLPRSGIEVYGELGREDHSYDTRDLILEPDHDLAYTLGFQRVWRRPAGAFLVLRGELMNSDVSHLYRIRPQGAPYMHTPVRQGHTQYGQLLGAAGGYGGGTTVVEAQWISPTGQRTVAWRRIPREPADIPTNPRDVAHAVSVAWTIFHARVDLRPEATGVYDINALGTNDRVNIRLALSGVAHW